MHPGAALIPWLDPSSILGVGGWVALLVVCAIIFAETGLLVGLIFPGDTLLVITGVFIHTGTMTSEHTGLHIPIWWACLAISAAAFLGGQVGYWIGHKGGPAVFERKESGIFSIENVQRTNSFFERFGTAAVILARFVPVVRTITPLLAGVGHMNLRRYTIDNAIGAVLWGSGVTLLGFVLGYIPWLKDLVVEYMDLVLVGAAAVSIGAALVHWLLNRRKAKQAGEPAASAAEVESLVADFERDIEE